ncbi:DEAD/DEAH box helicase [Desulfobulbus elongatus]|uniref:DEAD/DEAH box helicase n=1 Tax=Desulfobulbus elongatus TaxID=53332 RepID=UPI0004847EE1|nr:DEAD/DEAH box helicase [Desulfobulbus elongatus]
MQCSVAPQHEDPLFFDREGLTAVASSAVVGEGLRSFKEHRVIAIDQDQGRLWAQVEDEASDMPCTVGIAAADRVLRLECDCDDGTAVCRHMVAALYAYAEQKEATGHLFSAVDTAIRDRIKRGRSEVAVEHLNGTPWFGEWQAQSIGSESHFPQRYRVTIRSLKRRTNICTCPDFQVNQLGTCKHIEAVLHKIAKRKDYRKIREMPAPLSYVYLAWDVDDAPQIRLHRCGSLPPELAGLSARFFDGAGHFIGRLPDDFFRFVELVENRADLHLGDDAHDFVRHLAAKATHRLRAEKIRGRILATNGRLPGVRAKLYPYQIEGVAFLAGTGRALLADDMGLGKTLQAIAAAAWLREHEGVHRALIICPASLKHQWAREIERFTGLETRIIQGPAPERGVQYRREAAFFIINYELILRDLSVINETLCPDLIIMDEAQRIKNWRTKIAAAVKRVPGRYAFVLSGTPLENRLEDLYSLMQVVDPKVLGPLWRYLVDFHVTDDRGKVLGYRNLSLLRKRLAPVMLRRDRRLVREQLPDKIVQRLDVAMTDKQRELHDSAMSAAGRLAQIARTRPLTPSEQNRLLAALQQARMACNAAGLVDKETQGAPKLDELADILTEICLQSGLKAVVFSQWERMTQLVEARLERMGINCVRLHGGVPTAKRGELMDRFRDDDAVQVFLSTDAGGVGLNLQSGAVLINLDVPWNPAVLEQRNARIHRLGQTRTVQIITMVAADSYEEQVFALVRNKQELFDNVVGEDATEDVVGISKKLLETLIEDLAGPMAEPTPPAEDKIAPIEASTGSAPATVPAAAPVVEDGVAHAISRCIEALQQAFGSRIERIFGSGGGLVTVLDRVDADADRLAEQLSAEVPVALIDRLALKGLQRLGSGSPLAEEHRYFDAATTAAPSGESQLRRQAREKLTAARLLFDQRLFDSALDMIFAALLSAAAEKSGRDEPLNRTEVGIWAYAEALPRGILNQDQVGLLMRALSFAQGSTAPADLMQTLLDDAAHFVGSPGD